MFLRSENVDHQNFKKKILIQKKIDNFYSKNRKYQKAKNEKENVFYPLKNNVKKWRKQKMKKMLFICGNSTQTNFLKKFFF